jgi:hypothetical protein
MSPSSGRRAQGGGSSDGKGRAPTKSALLAVAGFAETFAREGFSAGAWRHEPCTLPMFMQAREVSDFVQLVYKRHVFLAYDWPAWQHEAERIESSADLVAAADLVTVRRLIARSLRADRFSDGALAGWIESGRAVRVLRRLGDLANG